MVNLLHNKVRPIGLDIGRTSVRMIQFAAAGDKLKVIAVDEAALDDCGDNPDAYQQNVLNAISGIMDKGQFQGKEVVSCLSNDEMKIKSFRLDDSGTKDIGAVIETEAQNKFNIDKKDYHIDYISAGNIKQGDERKNEVILFTAANDDIKKHIEFIEEVGLVPVSIDSVPCALFRCFIRTFRRQEDTEAINIFVDFGSLYTTLIITRNREICFVKQIPVGGHQLNEEVASRLDISIDEAVLMRTKLQNQEQSGLMDPATRQVIIDAMNSTIEELVKEISLCFKYFAVTFRGKRPQQAVFAGGEAYEQMLIASLNRQLSVEIDIAKPFRGIDVSSAQFFDDRRRSNCEWAVAVGLGLKGLNGIDKSNGSSEYERN